MTNWIVALARRGQPLWALLGWCWLLIGCGTVPVGQAPAEQLPAPTTSAAVTPANATADGSIEVAGMLEPESVLHDVANDRYLVSNINGNPFATDDNGFISWIAPDGTMIDERWIDGADTGVTLHAPKGMAIAGDTLYVADITVVRRFDLTSGQPLGEVAIPGATFLNDMVAAADGTLYVSDPGLRATADGFEAAGTDAIYAITPDGQVSQRASGTALGYPNGLALLPDGSLLAVTLNASRELYTVGDNGAPAAVRTVPGGQLDGLIALDDGSLLVSSWETNTIYRLGAEGSVTTVFSDPTSPAADIGLDAGRGRLLIPLFARNVVLLYPLAP
ncbi:MAG: ATP/GTP-binding protein [Chloroflexi bacterium OHK40]